MQMKHFWLHVEFMKRTMFNMLTMNNKLNEITIVFLTINAIFLLFVRIKFINQKIGLDFKFLLKI